MMKRLLAVLIALAPSAAFAVCPTTPSDCPGPTYKSLAIGGTPGTLSVAGVSTLTGAASLLGGASVTGALTSAAGSLVGTWGGSPTLTGNPTFSGAVTLSGGGTQLGTFTGAHTYSGAVSFTAGLSATTTAAATVSLGNSSTNATVSATGTNAGMNFTIPSGSGAMSFGQAGTFVQAINSTSVYPKTIVVGSANNQGSAAGTVTWSGANLLPPNVGLQVWSGWAGTLPGGTGTLGHGGVPEAFLTNIGADNLKIVGGVSYIANSIFHTVVGASATGSRSNLYNFLYFHNTTSDAAAGNQAAGIGVTNETFVDVGQGGTAVTIWNGTTGSNGSFWGAVNIANVAPPSGSQFYTQINATENDIVCNSHCSSNAVIGSQSVLMAAHATHGVAIDAAYSIGAQSGAAALWGVGYQFGQYAGVFPGDTASKAYAVLPASDWPSNTMPLGWGVYLTEATISNDAFASKLFSVDGSGNLSVGTLQAAPNGATTTIDTGYSVGDAAGATIATIGVGAGWPSSTFNLRLTDANRGVYYCSTVLAGTCTQVTVYRQPRVATASKPANPVTLTPDGNATQRGVTGTLTVNLTWTDGATLNVGNTTATTVNIGGGATTGLNLAGASAKLGFYGTAAIVKATPVGACAGNTGCQALRDALGNLGLISTGSITN